jgi:release factor glutamine methyltransferase
MGDNNWTVGKILAWTKEYFSEKGIENPSLDAEVLLCHVLLTDRLYLYTNFDRPLDQNELVSYRELVRVRAKRIPVAYALRKKEFMGIDFKVNETVLIPRPDTEILVETAINYLKNVNNPVIADIGTGSGAIIISILVKLNEAFGVATDVSPGALAAAKENAETHQVLSRVEFIAGDLFAPLAKNFPNKLFDAILSNPPYIKTANIATLSEEVWQEPQTALDGGADGLDFYRRLLKNGSDYLHENGFLAVEIGFGQAAEIEEIAKNTGLVLKETVKDYNGIDRVLLFVKV